MHCYFSKRRCIDAYRLIEQCVIYPEWGLITPWTKKVTSACVIWNFAIERECPIVHCLEIVSLFYLHIFEIVFWNPLDIFSTTDSSQSWQYFEYVKPFLLTLSSLPESYNNIVVLLGWREIVLRYTLVFDVQHNVTIC